MTSAGPYRVKALLLTAGLGTRLQPLTHRVPKCLVPIHGRPLLSYWFATLRETQVCDVLINTHHLREQVATYIELVNQDGRFRIKEFFEPKLLGSAGTIAANRDWMDNADACIVVYADNISAVDLCELIRFHQTHEDPFTMMLFRTEYPRQCGIATLDNVARIISFVEKPQSPSSDMANAGVYVISADAYREIADRRAFDMGHEILPLFIGRMRGWMYNGYHRDIGSCESLELAQQEAPKFINRWPGVSMQRAVFLDRDGTIIEHVHHLTEPAQVKLLPGAPEAIRRLQSHGYACVVVTNQSVVGRGKLSESGLQLVHDEIARQLDQFDVRLDGLYSNTLVPAQTDPTVIEHLDRKPGPGMIWRAAQELSLNVNESWMIGDSLSDGLAGRNAGCRGTILLHSSVDRNRVDQLGPKQYTAADLAAAANLILCQDQVDATGFGLPD